MLASDIVAPFDLPRYTNSAMDGYGVFAEMTSAATRTQPLLLPVAGNVEAGRAAPGLLPRASALRVGTGAYVPPPYDAVIPFEAIDEIGETIEIRAPIAPGANIRQRGEDVNSGSIVLEAGIRVRPPEIALLAALDVAELAVIPAPRVSILSIGPELMAGAAPERIGDANGPMLASLVSDTGATVAAIRQCSGASGELRGTLDELSLLSDLVITSGGVSNGPADTLSAFIDETPGIELWNLRLRPGKHYGAGRLGDAVVLSLPGNPVAAFVGFVLFGAAAIRALAGRSDQSRIKAIAEAPIRGGLGRTDAIRGVVQWGSDGVARIAPSVNRGSGVISTLLGVDCIILLGEDRDTVRAGDPVEICLVGNQ